MTTGDMRERQVDERVDDALAAELLAHQHERRRDAEDGVDRHRDDGDEHRQVEGVQRVGVGDRVERRPEAVLEGAVEDEAERQRPAAPPGRRATTVRSASLLRMAQRPPPQERERRSGRRRAISETARRRPPRRRPGSSCSMSPKTCSEATSVSNGMLPAISTIEPNSPSARANARPAPPRMAGTSVRQDDAAEGRQRRGPERGRRLLRLAVELDQHRLHRAHDERQRHEQQRHRRSRCACRRRRRRSG